MSGTTTASRVVRRLSRQYHGHCLSPHLQSCPRLILRKSGFTEPPPDLRRHFSASIHPRRQATAPTAFHTPHQYKPITAPSPDEVKEAEYEVELVPEAEARLGITEAAAEHLRAISLREDDANTALRVSVESGGCHGYQYKMDLTSGRQPDDYVFTHPTIKGANIVVDAMSLNLMKGSTIDFATELIGSSFRINNNPQAKGAGCGCGVSWELKM